MPKIRELCTNGSTDRRSYKPRLPENTMPMEISRRLPLECVMMIISGCRNGVHKGITFVRGKPKNRRNERDEKSKHKIHKCKCDACAKLRKK